MRFSDEDQSPDCNDVEGLRNTAAPADGLDALRQPVVLEGDAVDRCLDRGVEELGDGQHARDRGRLGEAGGGQRESDGNQHEGEQAFLAEGIFVYDGGADARQRIPEGVPDAG